MMVGCCGRSRDEPAAMCAVTVGSGRLLSAPAPATSRDGGGRARRGGPASHNTVMVDGLPQSIPDGPFRWQTRSDARPHAWRHNPAFDWAEASHDGYAPL